MRTNSWRVWIYAHTCMDEHLTRRGSVGWCFIQQMGAVTFGKARRKPVAPYVRVYATLTVEVLSGNYLYLINAYKADNLFRCYGCKALQVLRWKGGQGL